MGTRSCILITALYCLIFVAPTKGEIDRKSGVKSSNDTQIPEGKKNNSLDKKRETHDINYNHPKSYVSLYEVEPSGKRYPIFEAAKFRESGIDVSTNYEIDIDSKISIEFDYAWIDTNRPNLDLAVDIRANLRAGETVSPLEVPSYTRIGEEARIGRFSDQAIGVIGSIFNLNKEIDILGSSIGFKYLSTSKGGLKLSGISKVFDSTLDHFYQSPDSALLVKVVDLAEEHDESVRLFLMKWPNIGGGLQFVLEPQYGWFLGVFKEITENHPETIRIAAKLISEVHIKKLRELTYDNTFDADKIDPSLALQDTPAKMKAFARKYAKRYYAQRETVAAIRASTRSMLGTRRNWRYIERDTLTTNEENSVANGKITDETKRKRESMELKSKVNKLTLGMLKNSEIILRSNPIKPGNTITIDILNGSKKSDMSYVFPIQIVVRDFGWNKTITESFMFFQRIGVDAIMVEDVDSSKAGPLETPVQFEPAAGISLLWTLHPRRKNIIRFLSPGIGFNVSFPRFGSRIDSVFIDNNVGTVKTVSSESALGMTIGPALTLFDGALQVSAGYYVTELKVDDKRWFYSVGFSFLKAAKGIA